MTLDLNWIGIWDNYGDVAESVDFVVISCELPLPVTFSCCPEAIFMRFFHQFLQNFSRSHARYWSVLCTWQGVWRVARNLHNVIVVCKFVCVASPSQCGKLQVKSQVTKTATQVRLESSHLTEVYISGLYYIVRGLYTNAPSPRESFERASKDYLRLEKTIYRFKKTICGLKKTI